MKRTKDGGAIIEFKVRKKEKLSKKEFLVRRTQRNILRLIICFCALIITCLTYNWFWFISISLIMIGWRLKSGRRII